MNIDRYIRKIEKMKQTGSYNFLRNIQHNGFLVNCDERQMLNLSSDDYLGLSNYPPLLDEFRKMTDVESLLYGVASSRMNSGNHEYYTRLEDDLCDWYGKEAALVFSSGYHASVGILSALAGKRDLILSDRFVNAGIADGLRLCEAEVMHYHHMDVENLRKLLMQHRTNYENVFIVSESVFGMDGEIVDLHELCELKKEFDTMLYIDESQAVGVKGTNGLGCCEEYACVNDVDFIAGSFGKAFASIGGFVVCDDVFKEYLLNTQRNLIYSTALPSINVAWTRFVLNHMADFYELRIKLNDVASKLRNAILKSGYETRGNSHIVPCICGTNESSAELSEMLMDSGFYVLPEYYPFVPRNESRVRFTLNASIPNEDYECLFDFFNNLC